MKRLAVITLLLVFALPVLAQPRVSTYRGLSIDLDSGGHTVAELQAFIAKARKEDPRAHFAEVAVTYKSKVVEMTFDEFLKRLGFSESAEITGWKIKRNHAQAREIRGDLGALGVSYPQTPAPKPDAIKLPSERGAQLKQIQDRQEQLKKEFDQLEAQKVIIAQRAALELHLTAEQLDSMDLALLGDGYVFQPKKQAQAKPLEKKDDKQ